MMVRCITRGSLRAAWLLLTLTLLFAPALPLWQPAAAHDEVCRWTGAKSGNWHEPENWESCEGTPQSHDEVFIPETPRVPFIDSAAVVRRVTVSGGQLVLLDGAVLTVDEFFRGESGARITLNGTISGPFVAGSGETRLSASGSIAGPILVGGPLDPLAMLVVAPGSTIEAAGNVTVNGRLGLPDGAGGALRFTGASFVNNGAVSTPLIFSGSGGQSLSGSGQWHNTRRFAITAGSSTTLAGSLSLGVDLLEISNGGLLNVATHSLRLNGTARVYIDVSDVITGTGVVLVETNTTIGLDGTIHAPFEVAPGATATINGGGWLSGPVTVPEGAVLASSGAIPNLRHSLLLHGTLAGPGSIEFNGSTLTNNGRITVSSLIFSGGAQTLTGSGTISSTTNATVAETTRLTLGSDHQMGKVNITGMATLDISGRTLVLTGAPAPLTKQGAFVTAESTVVYSGTAAQTVTTSGVSYHNLTLNNSVGTVQAAAALVVNGLLRMQAGTFAAGACTCGDVRIDAGARLSTAGNSIQTVRGNWRNDGDFNAGSGSTVAFAGSAAQEIAGGVPSNFDGLRLANSAGVTLKTDARVQRRLTLDGDLQTGAATLSMPPAAISSGSGDVFGRVRRGGPLVAGVAYSFGNPNVSLTFADGGTLPSEVLLTLTATAPAGLLQPVSRSYSIEAAGGSGVKATLRLRYRETELNGVAEQRIQLWRYDSAGQRWVMQGRGSADTAQNWVDQSGVVPFGAWGLATPRLVFSPLIVR